MERVINETTFHDMVDNYMCIEDDPMVIDAIVYEAVKELGGDGSNYEEEDGD